MNKSIPSYLKLVTDTPSAISRADSEDLASIALVCQAFEQATGWQLEYAAGQVPSAKPNLMWSAPVNPGVGDSPGHIRLISTEGETAGPEPMAIEVASQLAKAVGTLWGELLVTRHALAAREAELAVGVPLVLHEDDSALPGLCERLESVLRGGAEAVGCQAAGLYVLDAATTELKLRSSWGLPRKRLTAPARPLRGALGDLEALLGHAVVLSDEKLNAHWKVPEEDFGSCVCVPVSSPTMPLGTLWVFCHEARDFSDAQTNILEVVAGRLAADLERQVLVEEAFVSRDQTKQIAAAEQAQQDQLPRVAPMIEGWEIAAKAYHAGPLGGAFYDWFSLDDGAVAVLAGDSIDRGVNGALTAAVMRGAARATSRQRRSGPQKLLEKTNSVLWTGSSGNQCAGLFQAIVEPRASSLSFAAAGPMRVLSVARNRYGVLAGPTSPLGLEEDVSLSEVIHRATPGELLVVYGTSFLPEGENLAMVDLDQRLASALQASMTLSAAKLSEIAANILRNHPAVEQAHRVVALVKRR